MSSSSPSNSLLYNISAYEPTEQWHNILHLLPSLSTFYVLYEQLLLGKPIIVLGQTPQHTSAVISALIDLIRPLPYAGIVRPYLPMQSTSFSSDVHLFDPVTSPRSFIIGITNPFLLQRVNGNAPASREPPYILALNNSRVSSITGNGAVSSPALSGGTKYKLPSLHLHRSKSKLSSTRIDVPGIPTLTQEKPAHFLKSDKTFLSAIADGGCTPASTMAVRRHFSDLTAQLLAPANRYMASNVSGNAAPARSSAISMAATMPTAVSSTGKYPFDFPTFLKSLSQYGATVPFTGQTSHGRQRSRDEFYAQFTQSANFQAWLDMRSDNEKQAAAGMLSGTT
jgi:hypothetical protein